MDKKRIKQSRTKDPRENKYQIGIIVAIIFMLIYGYSLYLSVRLGRTTKIYINGAVLFGWFLLCLYWLRQLGLIHKARQQKEDSTS